MNLPDFGVRRPVTNLMIFFGIIILSLFALSRLGVDMMPEIEPPAISVISVKVFNWGLLGIAWSNLLPQLLISGVILPIYFNRKMSISASESVRNVWLPALLGSLPAVAVIGVWDYLAPPDSWLEILGVVVAAMVVTFVGGWFLSLEDIERRRFARIARRR